jgi:prevent-host-death family protein
MHTKRTRSQYSKDIVPLKRARAELGELVEEVQSKHIEIIITKKGKRCAALVDVERLDHYHWLEREHIHLTLLEEVIRGLDDSKHGRTFDLAKLKSRHGR